MSRHQHLPSVQMGTWALTVMPAEIDMANAPDLGHDLRSLLDQGGTVLVVDMTQTGFCDSAGVRMLVLAHQQAAQQGSELRLIAPPSQVRRVLGLSGADQVLRVFPTMSEALMDAPTGLQALDGQSQDRES